MANVQKVSTGLHSVLAPFVDEIRQVIRYTRTLGVTRPIVFRPLMESKNFEGGVFFQYVRLGKRSETVAAGGRYVGNQQVC